MNKNLNHFLAYLGCLPFVIAAIFFSAKLQFMPAAFLENIVKSYGLTIISFMSGVNWGQYLTFKQRPKLNLFLISNIITLLCWFSFFLISSSRFFLNLIFSFLSLLAVDYHLKQLDLIEVKYFQTRINVTVIVCLSLALIKISF
jgi:hypothetical protein